jgi:hypothetical protein
MNSHDNFCLWFWILTPIALLSFTGLNLSQIIVIMIVLAVIFKLLSIGCPITFFSKYIPIQNQIIGAEGFLPGCQTCNNPYENYLKKMLPKTLIIARTDQQPLTPAQAERLKQQELNSAQGPPAPPEIALPVAIQIEIPKPQKIIQPTPVKVQPAKNQLCQALEQSGFNPRWTYDDVRNLWGTEEGRATLKTLNDSVIKATGLSRLTNQQITSCYPKYISDYSCQAKPKIDMVKLRETINKQQFQIQSLKKQLQQDTESTLSKSVLTADQEESDVTRSVQGQVPNQCPINQITSQIRLEVEKFYGQSYEKLSGQLTQTETEALKSQYSTLAQTVKIKAVNEYLELINLYRNQNGGQWARDLIKRKTNSSRGHPVLGTDFYIPWTLFDQNTTCFGNKV